MKQKILIVEDEARLASLLRDYLEQAGFAADCLHSGAEVVPRVSGQEPALILLDLMLPDRDGMDICREIRGFSSVPIIMVTARVEEIDRLLGLEFGADDYICKPFSPREVVARVKAVLRRAASPQGLPEQGLEIDRQRYRATLKGQDLGLTALEFQLLSILADHPGHIHSRDQLMSSIYSDARIVTDRTIDSHIMKLRKKIAYVVPDREFICSVYGVGYKYELSWGGRQDVRPGSGGKRRPFCKAATAK